jgi:membrane protein
MQSAAALSYFSLFSLAPLVIAIVAVAGLFVSNADVQTALIEHIRDIVNDETADLVETIIANSVDQERNIVSLIIAGVLIAVGATSAFAQLHAILNRVWNAPVPQSQGMVIRIFAHYRNAVGGFAHVQHVSRVV